MTRQVWRITTHRFAHEAFTGEGARRFGGRWNPKGIAMIYTADSQSLALLEMLVQDTPLRAGYVLIPALIPEDFAVTILQSGDLPPDWRNPAARPALQSIGRAWVASLGTAILGVPSSVVPGDRNYLLNPAHPDFQAIALGNPVDLSTDLRLLRNRDPGEPDD